MCKEADRIVNFWVEEVGPKGWYKSTDALDSAIREEFGALWECAAMGEYTAWLVSPQKALALLILLDQFPRNMFRGEGKAFASDSVALAVAKRAIVMGHDLKTPEPQRQFFYLPLMHSESLMDQERCVRLMALRMPQAGATQLQHARAHRDVIRQFGRFPYRNAALGRATTPAEAEYLKNGGYSSSVKANAA